jgi:mono/diheme cytochrome c family protein
LSQAGALTVRKGRERSLSRECIDRMRRTTHRRWTAGIVIVLALGAVATARAADDATEPSTAEVKKLFAANCSWCHGSYGMTADKGPQLAGTQMTEEQVKTRIRGGKEGYMPAFGKVLSEAEIDAFAKYIKGLKVEE